MLASQRIHVQDLISKALKEIGAPDDVVVFLERPKQRTHGDIACNVAMQLAKTMREPPRNIAAKLVAKLKELSADTEIFSCIEIAGPGFINFKLSNATKQEVVRQILQQTDKFGSSEAHKGESLLLEYVSANPTGPLHLGHARQGALGDVLANLFRSQGYQVTREFYYNDAGVQIQNLATSVQARAKELLGQPVVFPEDGYRGEYVKEVAQDYIDKKAVHTFDGKVIESNGDVSDLDSIRKYSVAYLRNEQNRDLDALGVHFDNYYLESSLYTDHRVDAAVKAIVDSGKTYEKDGALWFKSSDYGDDKDRVMKKHDGTYTYFVPDVAYHLAKFERGFNRAINIQGTDHHGTMARVRAGIQAASPAYGFSIPKDFPQYLLHTMLQVYKDGEIVKMSKRSGTGVTLIDLVNWVGKDAARLFLVNRKADAEFNFDVDLALSQSDENPVYYLQYAHARICSIFAQAAEKGFYIPSINEALKFSLLPLNTPTELTLMNTLSDYPETLTNAAEDLAPHALVTYLKQLSSDFHAFYNAERVLVDEPVTRNARFALLLAIRQVLRNGFKILGISAPDRLDRSTEQ